MFWLAVALLIGEYSLALIIKAVFGLKFEPLIVPIVTVVVGFAAFFLFIVFITLKTLAGG
jgi:hypothetical protein